MLRSGVLFILTALVYVNQVKSIELLANYKLWKSVSDQLVYDFSGNSRHGRLYFTYAFTDRGLTPSSSGGYALTLMNYGFLTLREYTISQWMLNFGIDSSYSRIVVYNGPESLWIRYLYNNPSDTYLILHRNGGVLSTTNLNLRIEGWNLHTITLYVDSSNPNRLNFNLYRNFEHIYSSHIDSALTAINISELKVVGSDGSTTSGIILNEVWVHKGFSFISDLNYLMSNPISCGCEYKCPTTPNQTCLQAFGEIYNKSGELCDTSCTNNNPKLSCYSGNNCITRRKAECQYGLYDRETAECVFYCPYNSCECPTLVASSVSTLLSCSCKAGYKNILDIALACISNRCLVYHNAGYKYICDTTESGYILDSLGECCVCASGFSQVSADPIVCVNTSICLSHIISGVDYTCSSCSDGYAIDSGGKCNSCSSGYVNVLANPYTCVLKIDNCEEYIYLDNLWKCELCSEGYATDSEGKCNSCSSGYVNALTNPYTCIFKINNCEEHIYLDNLWKCEVCEQGYKKGSSGLCDECDVNYSKVESESLLCEPYISKCIEYEINQESPRCMKCEKEYRIDHNYECTTCMQGYTNLPHDSSICIKKISKCLEYELVEDIWICIRCELGYDIDEEMECKNCSKDYIYSPNSPSECILKPNDTDLEPLSNEEEKETLSQAQIQRGDKIASSNNISINTASGSTAAASIISMDPNSLILYINTIQLLSLIQHLNIKLPFEIRKQQSSTDKLMRQTNIISYIKIRDKDLKETMLSTMSDERSFLGNSIYQTLVHMILARPFKDKMLNAFMILVEACLTACYSASGLLLLSELDHDIIMWAILGSIYLSYFLHSAIGYYKIFNILYPRIRTWYTRWVANNQITRKTEIPSQQ